MFLQVSPSPHLFLRYLLAPLLGFPYSAERQAKARKAMATTPATNGAAMKFAREVLGRPLGRTADALDTTAGHLSNIEADRRRPSWALLTRWIEHMPYEDKELLWQVVLPAGLPDEQDACIATGAVA